jgi:hypothetical protein
LTINLNRSTFSSLEFLLLLLGNAAAWLAQLQGSLDTRWAVYASATSVALYALVRGLAKMNVDTKSYWNTTEFWTAIVGSAPAMLAAYQGTISTHTYALIQAGIGAMLAVSQGLRKVPAVQAAQAPPRRRKVKEAPPAP